MTTIAASLEHPEINYSKFNKKSAKFWQNFAKNQQKIQQFFTKKLRLENGRPLAKLFTIYLVRSPLASPLGRLGPLLPSRWDQ